ncbi:MAG: FAD-dependent oxidoreductase, partial [Planctomycetes bacterium]|nr:FAD-dependent oxidoreductase [Planctomycetota bacterium]
KRVKTIGLLFNEAKLNKESNICFGEGGAGTFSDGKLTTRKNHPWIRWILDYLVDCGAPQEIATSGKPHIGSDRLRKVVIEMRKRLLAKGVRVEFGAHVSDMTLEGEAIQSLRCADGREWTELDAVIWATGHSARDSYRLLEEKKIPLESKAFAVGFRIEHPQELVNHWQHKKCKEEVGAADYSVVHNIDKERSVYSFCMCPGGQIVCSSSHEGYHVVNGMSNYARNAQYANSGLVIKVSPADFPNKGVMAGIDFQCEIESKAYQSVGGRYVGPAQRVSDYMAGRISSDLPGSSYKPGLESVDMRTFLPEALKESMLKALPAFEKKFPGFSSSDALFIGTETRTSAPLRIPRKESGCSEGVSNFYPCGEGAGYAGGIISAALDGLYIGERIAQRG